MTKQEQIQEWLSCSYSFPYFVDNYCKIYDATAGAWIPFQLWPDQVRVAEDLNKHRLHAILKARQLGLTWLVLAYILWLMLFHPAVTILIFSRREVEAIYLLDKRLKKMYERLPEWMNVRTIVSSSSHIWELSNGSIAYAFPTSAGDSYTATLAFVDEADLIPDLDTLMLSVKPTIDGGGRMVLLSRSNKETPNSSFKQTYLAASAGTNEWFSTFLPWYSKPTRTQEWYDSMKEDFESRTGSLDGLYEQYPASPEEALSPKSQNKRIPFAWLKRCYVPLKGAVHPTVPCTKFYAEVKQYHSYIISADPAEGNPTSDYSSAHVFDAVTLEEQAIMVDKIEPTLFGQYLIQLSEAYNNATILVERNNHGHAVIGAIKQLGKADLLIQGPDGKFGWPEMAKTKALLYDRGSKMFRDGSCTIHTETTFIQLSSIEGSTLKAPEGMFDDQAVSCMLGLVAGTIIPPKSFGYRYDNLSKSTNSIQRRRIGLTRSPVGTRTR